MTAFLSIGEDQIALASKRYNDGEAVAVIARDLGITTYNLRKCARELGWPERPAKRRAPSRGRRKTNADALAEGSGTRALARNVENAVRRELAGLEKRMSASCDAADAERNARVLASLVKSLAELSRLDAARTTKSSGVRDKDSRSDAETDDERPPVDLAQLRAELAARLERIRAERRTE